MVADADRKRRCEEEIAKLLGITAHYVIISRPPIRSLNYVSQTEKPNLEAIMIFDEKREVLEFLPEYTGELFFVRPATAAASLETVQVYAPLDGANKQNLLKLEVEIQRILRAH